MRLVLDTNIVVAALIRERGRRLISQPALSCLMSERAWSETHDELPKRFAHLRARGVLAPATADALEAAVMMVLHTHVQPVAQLLVAAHEVAARARIPRDPQDWPTVAVALALDAAIWTHDADFLGCGLPVWTTETLVAHLAGSGQLLDWS